MSMKWNRDNARPVSATGRPLASSKWEGVHWHPFSGSGRFVCSVFFFRLRRTMIRGLLHISKDYDVPMGHCYPDMYVSDAIASAVSTVYTRHQAKPNRCTCRYLEYMALRLYTDTDSSIRSLYIHVSYTRLSFSRLQRRTMAQQHETHRTAVMHLGIIVTVAFCDCGCECFRGAGVFLQFFLGTKKKDVAFTGFI